jgi:hypothetical protein
MFAAFIAVWIATKAPRLAAKYAEEYRRETAAADEQRALQVHVARLLMKGRSEILSLDSRTALNLVEVAFPTDKAVRNARRLFTKAAQANPFSADNLVASYLSLIEVVAHAVGMEDIDRFDIESGYYPEALSRLDEAAIIEAERKIAEAKSAKSMIDPLS